MSRQVQKLDCVGSTSDGIGRGLICGRRKGRVVDAGDAGANSVVGWLSGQKTPPGYMILAVVVVVKRVVVGKKGTQQRDDERKKK